MKCKKKKTGRLFNFCCLAPGIIANKKNSEKTFLKNLGEDIGLLFQLTDDFLDIKGSKKILGKSIRKDKKKGKSTLINLIGYEKADKYANNLKIKILRKLKKRGKKAKELNNIIEFILGRKY